MESRRVFFVAQMVSRLKYPFWDYGLLDCERKTQIRVPFLFRQRKERLVKFGNVELFTRWWFQTFFYFHPYLRKIANLTNIFQMG